MYLNQESLSIFFFLSPSTYVLLKILLHRSEPFVSFEGKRVKRQRFCFIINLQVINSLIHLLKT